MALLTDPSGLKGRPFKFLVQRHKFVCFLLYVSSIGLFLCLASDQLNSVTYLSENALLPGLVVVGADVSQESNQILNEIENYVLDENEIPVEWLREKFSKASIESHVHNFTLKGDSMHYVGRNVYGIIHGGGGGGEAAVLSVPWRGTSSPHPATASGLALLLAIGKYFRKQKYWAKDLILLVTENEQLGAQAWLDAYHGVCSGTGVLKSGELEARSGAIQAAVVLELESPRMKSLDVKILGLNGQLPNLDLVNLALRIASKERIAHSVQGKEKIHNSESWEQWSRSVKTMLSMVISQAHAVPNGNHGLFHRFGIEAITLVGTEHKGHGHLVTLHHVGRIIEGLFRSINNLLERFHQSYFFYILADTDRFVSIGLYMPCNGMLVAALFIRAFSLHLEMRSAKDERDWNISGVSAMILISLFIGFTAYSVTNLTVYLPQDITPRDRTAISFALITVFSIIAPFLILYKYKKNGDWLMLHVLALVSLGTLLLSVGMSNFSLAFLSGLILTPFALFLSPSSYRPLKILLWLAIHPLSLLLGVLAVNKYFQEFDLPLIEAAKNSLYLATLDHKIYGSWTLRIFCLGYLSVWTALVPTPLKAKDHQKTE